MSYKIFKAKFPGQCKATGMNISIGEIIAWYPESKATFKLCTVYPNSDISKLSCYSHPVFQYVEQMFNNWIETSQPASEYAEMYFSEEAIYDKKGAIIGAIENLIEQANEEGKPVHVHACDVECAFE